MIYHKDWILPSIESCQNVVQSFIDNPNHGLTEFNGHTITHDKDSETYLISVDLNNWSFIGTSTYRYIWYGFLYTNIVNEENIILSVIDNSVSYNEFTTYNSSDSPSYLRAYPVIFNYLVDTSGLNNVNASFFGYRFNIVPPQV